MELRPYQFLPRGRYSTVEDYPWKVETPYPLPQTKTLPQTVSCDAKKIEISFSTQHYQFPVARASPCARFQSVQDDDADADADPPSKSSIATQTTNPAENYSSPASPAALSKNPVHYHESCSPGCFLPTPRSFDYYPRSSRFSVDQCRHRLQVGAYAGSYWSVRIAVGWRRHRLAATSEA